MPMHDFMPMYQWFCKMAKASGSNGLVCNNIMREGFNASRSDMNRAMTDTEPLSRIAVTGTEPISGIASLPEISKKRKAKRKKKVTSPARKGRKK